MMWPESNSAWVRTSTSTAPWFSRRTASVGPDGLAARARTAEFIGRRHQREQHRAADQERVPGGIFEKTIHQ